MIKVNDKKLKSPHTISTAMTFACCWTLYCGQQYTSWYALPSIPIDQRFKERKYVNRKSWLGVLFSHLIIRIGECIRLTKRGKRALELAEHCTLFYTCKNFMNTRAIIVDRFSYHENLSVQLQMYPRNTTVSALRMTPGQLVWCPTFRRQALVAVCRTKPCPQ
jgi:hypothetical protein